MQFRGKIVNFTITEGKGNMSLKLRIDGSCTGETLDEIRKLKGVLQHYSLTEIDNTKSTLYFDGEIHSINIQQGLGITLYAPVATPLILKAVDIMNKPLYVRFATGAEQEIAELLEKVAKRESVSTEEMLVRLTKYSKDGREWPGRNSIYKLSDAQRRVVLDKLRKMIRP